MIKNEKQYRITVAQLNSFAKTIEDLKQSDVSKASVFFSAQIEALQSQYEELYQEVEEYTELKAGNFDANQIQSFSDLPQGLIRARIALGMSQKDLAEKLGMKEQQIQRYEATEYASASFERIREVIEALGLEIKNEVFLSESVVSQTRLFGNIKSLGFDKSFVLEKMLPSVIANRIVDAGTSSQQGSIKKIITEAASFLGKLFSIDPIQLLAPSARFDVTLSELPQLSARFKKAKNANSKKINAYSLYAHMMALNVLEATADHKQYEVPDDPAVVRKKLLTGYGAINFESAIRYIWSLGIPVLPTKDFGNFNGACWRIEGRNIIVLNKKTNAPVKWTFDALHELKHAGQHKEQDAFEVIEPEQFMRGMSGEEDEIEANDFAAEILLGEKADDMTEQCVIRADRHPSRLKTAVQNVAREYNVDVGALANHLAFRLSVEKNKNWWSTAINLQTNDSESFDVAREIFFEKVSLNNLNEFDRELVMKAVM